MRRCQPLAMGNPKFLSLTNMLISVIVLLRVRRPRNNKLLVILLLLFHFWNLPDSHISFNY